MPGGAEDSKTHAFGTQTTAFARMQRSGWHAARPRTAQLGDLQRDVFIYMKNQIQFARSLCSYSGVACDLHVVQKSLNSVLTFIYRFFQMNGERGGIIIRATFRAINTDELLAF